MDVIPLFPLNTVFFPGTVLPLRIFERRYLDLVRDCMRDQNGFGICLIKDGEEVGDAPEVYLQGTYAHIVDWGQTADGLLQITVEGGQCFSIDDHQQTDSGVRQANIRWLPRPASRLAPSRYDQLRLLMQKLALDFFPQYEAVASAQQVDCEWLGCRLAECLPLDVTQKQMLLEIQQPDRRLDVLQGLLQETLDTLGDNPD